MREMTVTPDEIRQTFETTLEGKFPFHKRQVHLEDVVEGWRQPEDGWRSRWQGVSGAQMFDMLEHGWTPEGDAPELDMGSAEVDVPMIDLFEEDGDLLIDAALNGDDLIYARWENFPAQRGLKIRANVAFNAGTEAQVMIDYCGWILRMIDAAERRGIAPDVELFYDVDDLHGDKKRIRILVPLVKAGQLTDVTAWRAFMHGAAFRTLGFAAFGLVSDQLGKVARSGLGRSFGPKWDVEFSDDVLTILSPGHADSFPEEAMTAKVEAALA